MCDLTVARQQFAALMMQANSAHIHQYHTKFFPASLEYTLQKVETLVLVWTRTLENGHFFAEWVHLAKRC
jgi:O-acetylhomoserine/O-acetylserine sulfhydrylase-like pyridoxal-dependent enzyme